jgi:hypothetical protein
MLKDRHVCMQKSTCAKISSCCALAYSSRQALRIRFYSIDHDTPTPSLRTCLILAADLPYTQVFVEINLLIKGPDHGLRYIVSCYEPRYLTLLLNLSTTNKYSGFLTFRCSTAVLSSPSLYINILSTILSNIIDFKGRP